MILLNCTHFGVVTFQLFYDLVFLFTHFILFPFYLDIHCLFVLGLIIKGFLLWMYLFFYIYIYNLCTLVLDYGLVHSKDFVIIQVENWTLISIISGYTIVAVLWLFEFFSTQTWFQSKSSLSSSKLSHLFLSVWAENLRLCSSRIFNEEH